MLSPQVEYLLQHAIDSPEKLHLLLIFHEQAVVQTTPKFMAERTYRDIWSVRQALHEMAEDEILQIAPSSVPSDDPEYLYQPSPLYRDAITSLIQQYNNPLKRFEVRGAMRKATEQAVMRRVSTHNSVF